MARGVVGAAMVAVGASLIVAFFLPVWVLILLGGVLLVAAGVFLLSC